MMSKKGFVILMNTYFAVSLDLYNKKEYILYSIGGREIRKVRELGELLFDFADQGDTPERYNAAAEYLSCFSEKKITPLITENYFERQKHLHLNEEHRFTSYGLIGCLFDNKNKSDRLISFYLNDRLYTAIEDNFELLLQYYLDVIYSVNLFPRKCMNCGLLFLSGKKHGDVLCSVECRKKKKSQNSMAYYRRLSENEILYTKLYRKWRLRITKNKNNNKFDDESIERLENKLQDFIKINRIASQNYKSEKISCEEYLDRIVMCEKELNDLFFEIKKERCLLENKKG